MPFKSKAQAKFMFAKKPELAKEFASKTSSIKALPAKMPMKKHEKKESKMKEKKEHKRKGYKD